MTRGQQFPADSEGDALRQLAEAGCDMTRPMTFEFHVAAPTEESANQVAAAVAKLGYEAELFFDDGEEDDPDDPLPPWTCECTKVMLPTYDAVVGAQAELDKIARQFGAYVDGWGSFGE